MPGQQAVSALLLFLPFIALVRNDQPVKATALIALAFGIHSLLAISLAAGDTAALDDVMPGGEQYWQQQETWIRTGQDPEYETKNWLPAHLQLLGGAGVLSFTSLGLLPLLEGMKEVDLMNFYVGRLAAVSHSPAAAVLIGWHPWSVLRGFAYAILVFEIASLSLQQLCGRTLSTARRRAWRWWLGLGLFACDCVVKYFTLDPVRVQLFRNLQL
jgi:hypothetical protein